MHYQRLRSQGGDCGKAMWPKGWLGLHPTPHAAFTQAMPGAMPFPGSPPTPPGTCSYPPCLTCSSASTRVCSLCTSALAVGSTPGAEPVLVREPHPTRLIPATVPAVGTVEMRGCGPAICLAHVTHGPGSARPANPLACQWVPHRGPARLAAGLLTAHYYSRYEFEVSQRVPKVIMSRHQQRDGVSWMPGCQGGQLLPLAWLRGLYCPPG